MQGRQRVAGELLKLPIATRGRLAVKQLYRLIVIDDHRVSVVAIEIPVVLGSEFVAQLAMIDVEGRLATRCLWLARSRSDAHRPGYDQQSSGRQNGGHPDLPISGRACQVRFRPCRSAPRARQIPGLVWSIRAAPSLQEPRRQAALRDWFARPLYRPQSSTRVTKPVRSRQSLSQGVSRSPAPPVSRTYPVNRDPYRRFPCTQSCPG